MSRAGVGRRCWIAWAAVVATGACDAPPAPTTTCWREEPAAAAEAPAWVPIGETALDTDGRTPRVAVDVPDQTGAITLRVSDPAGAPACVQLGPIDTADGLDWVTASVGGDLGPYCVGCPQRVAVGVGYGLYVLPSNDEPLAPPGQLGIAAAARDCATMGTVEPGAPARLRIEALFRPPVPAERRGVLDLGLAFTAASALADPRRRDAVVPRALALVNALLAPGGLEVQVARTRLVAGVHPLAPARGDHGVLDRVYRELREEPVCTAPPEDGWIPVVFSGCLRLEDPVLHTSQQPDALTTGIPSGFPPPGRAHGIFLKGRSCRPTADPVDWPPSLLAKLLAHELGHYLGLYHSVEDDGTTDQLADTDERNIMTARPLEQGVQGFSPGQFQVMRRHPAVRWR